MNLTEADIIKRVMEIFSVYGVRSLSMDNIAQHIPTTKRNLLKVARNKEELVRHIFNYCMTRFQNMLRQQSLNMVAENVIDEILQQVSIMHALSNEFNPHLDFEFRKYYPEIYAEHSEIRDRYLIQDLHNNIERGKAQNVYSQDCDTDRLANEIFEDFQKLKTEFDNANTGRGQMIDCEQISMRFLSAMIEKLANEQGKDYFRKRLTAQRIRNEGMKIEREST
jgi:AcrR family transcriptional regulator